MSKVTRVDIPTVNSAMNNLNEITDRFEEAVAKMKRIAASLDGCWGDDKFGKKFAEGYLPYADATLDNADISVTTLRDIEANLRLIAKMFDELDAESVGGLELIEK